MKYRQHTGEEEKGETDNSMYLKIVDNSDNGTQTQAGNRHSLSLAKMAISRDEVQLRI